MKKKIINMMKILEKISETSKILYSKITWNDNIEPYLISMINKGEVMGFSYQTYQIAKHKLKS